jgi:hypothetical protein
MNPKLRSSLISSPITLHLLSLKRRRHVEVHFEEVDERAFLFRIEHHPDTERVAIVGDDRILDILSGLERAGRSLGQLGNVSVLGGRLSVEPLGLDERFSELKAPCIAFECVLEHSPHY